MAPNYAEESRDPNKIAKAATYGSVIGLGVFYIFVSYMFVTGWGLTGSAHGGRRPVRGQDRLGVLPADRPYVGSGLTTLMQILIVTSSFACAMAFYNTGARYLFALGREGVLPGALGPHAPDRHSPVDGVDGRDGDRRRLHARLHAVRPEHRGRAAQARHLDAAARRARASWPCRRLGSVAIIRFFLTEAATASTGSRRWSRRSLGFAAMVAACLLLIVNRGCLSGAGDALFIKFLPWVVLVVFVLGIVLAARPAEQGARALRQIGQFEMTDSARAADRRNLWSTGMTAVEDPAARPRPTRSSR